MGSLGSPLHHAWGAWGPLSGACAPLLCLGVAPSTRTLRRKACSPYRPPALGSPREEEGLSQRPCPVRLPLPNPPHPAPPGDAPLSLPGRPSSIGWPCPAPRLPRDVFGRLVGLSAQPCRRESRRPAGPRGQDEPRGLLPPGPELLMSLTASGRPPGKALLGPATVNFPLHAGRGWAREGP